MGLVKENLLTKGFSGKIGDEIVFRQVDNRTLFAKRPRKRKVLAPSEQSVRFSKAVLYAKTSLLDPDLLADYQNMAIAAGLKSAYIAAVTDYLKAPSINLIYTDLYSGEVGSLIWITALDDFKIKTVTVTLQKPDGTLIETGSATEENGRWKYAATQANIALIGTRVVVKVSDRTGQEASTEKVLA